MQNVGGIHYHMCSNLLSADVSEVSVGYRFAYFIRCVFLVILNYSLYLFILHKNFFNCASYV